MRKVITIVALCALAGCQNTPQVVSNVHTGNKVYAGKASNAYTGLLDWLQVRPFYSVQKGYGFNTLYSSYGWKYLSEAWSFGSRLTYERRNNEVGPCGGAGGCITLEHGAVILSEAQFRAAAVSGFEFQLRGSGGDVTGKIPAARFKEVLTLLDAGK